MCLLRSEAEFCLSAFGFFDELTERLSIVHGHIGENAAIELDTCFFQAVHELGVFHTYHAGCSIDPYNPQRAKVSLLDAAIAVGKAKGSLNNVHCDFESVVSGAAKPFGEFQYLLAALPCFCST